MYTDPDPGASYIVLFWAIGSESDGDRFAGYGQSDTEFRTIDVP